MVVLGARAGLLLAAGSVVAVAMVGLACVAGPGAVLPRAGASGAAGVAAVGFLVFSLPFFWLAGGLGPVPAQVWPALLPPLVPFLPVPPGPLPL